MVGTGKGAERGILIKNGEILQSTGKITSIILDKTGTITLGKPELQNIYPLNDELNNNLLHFDELLKIAASLEYNSEHPLAQAIVNASESKELDLLDATNFISIPGKGGKSYNK